MAKRILKNGISVRVIDGDSFNKHWMRFYYKSVKKSVEKWNTLVPARERMFIRSDFTKVKNFLHKKITDCGLNPDEVMADLFIKTMKWTEILKSRAIKAASSILDEEDFEQIDLEVTELKAEMNYQIRLKNTYEVLGPILSSMVRENPKSSNFSKLLLSDLQTKIEMSQTAVEKIEGKINSISGRDFKDKVIYEIEQILSKKTKHQRRLKLSREAVGEILGFVFREPKPVTGWHKAMATAINSHKRTLKEIKK